MFWSRLKNMTLSSWSHDFLKFWHPSPESSCHNFLLLRLFNIWVEFCFFRGNFFFFFFSQFEFWVLSQFHLSFETIWVFEFGHSLSWLFLSHKFSIIKQFQLQIFCIIIFFLAEKKIITQILLTQFLFVTTVFVTKCFFLSQLFFLTIFFSLRLYFFFK